MRHQNRVKKMNRTKSHRDALFMNLANALFDHESIKTTNPKAMELKKVAERLITLAKKKDLHSLRLAFAILRDKKIVRKLFSDIGDRYAAINGGYTRVVKIGLRKGDAAPMAIIELTQKKESEKEPEKGKAKPKKEAKAKPAKEAKEKKEKAPAKKKAAAPSGEEKPKRTRKPKAEKKAEEPATEEA
jgi:large subunit ribosomal protein L17